MLKTASKPDSSTFSKTLTSRFLAEFTVSGIDLIFFEFLIKLWEISNEKVEGLVEGGRREGGGRREEGGGGEEWKKREEGRRKMVTKKFEKISGVEMFWEVMENSTRKEVA